MMWCGEYLVTVCALNSSEFHDLGRDARQAPAGAQGERTGPTGVRMSLVREGAAAARTGRPPPRTRTGLGVNVAVILTYPCIIH